MTVECCADGLTTELRSELANSNVQVDEQYCLQRCGLCYHEAFVVIDGVVVRGADADALGAKLRERGVLEEESER